MAWGKTIMKCNWTLVLVAVTALAASGCRTYNYRMVQPAASAQVIGKQAITVRYDPLEYRFSRDRDRLAMRIINPTADRIVLRGDRSFVIDPQGESHPLHGRVIGPRSFAAFRLPPEPAGGEVIGSYGPGWGPGFYSYGPYPYYGYGFYGGFYGPPIATYQVHTPYDWAWRSGPARLRLGYERNGKLFEQDFEFVRERQR